MPTIVRKATASAAVLMLVSCSSQPTAPARTASAPAAGVAECIADLGGDVQTTTRVLDPAGINVVNWNIQKGRSTAWVGDLSDREIGPDLLILQEASVKTDAWQDIVPEHFSSFAEGFGPNWAPSGVMTVSAAEPLTECELVAHEPWFGTRKATLITEYAMDDSDETLLVVNIHGINFALGVRDLTDQFAQAKAVVEAHDGPVLFSGDFNTWRVQRKRVLEDMLTALGLEALEFDIDHRKKFFGSALDHIYVRGLTSEHATTMKSRASDHNPMSVRLKLVDEPLRVSAPR